MEQVSYNLRLDLKDTGIVNTGFRLKQGDSGMKISVSIFNRGVNVFDSTTVPKIVFKRPDGASVMANMTVGSSVYEYVFVGNELQQPGVEIMDVKFTLPNDRRESTVSCSFVVVPDTITPNTHGSDIYDNDLAELVEEATEAAESVVEIVGDSEAWAIGERNGVPVGPEDPAYHNNSKYWSEQANPTRLENLTDVDINNRANEDGLVYNSTSQKWENKQIVQKNQISNPNLLDNPWFTVNQRGEVTYNTPWGMSVDRWRTDQGIALTVTNSGVQITNSHATDWRNLYMQVLEEDYKNLVGRPITMSVMLSDGTIKSGTITAPPMATSQIEMYPIVDGGTFGAGMFMIYNQSPIAAQYYIGIPAGGTLNIRAVKIELGTVSTLGLDTAPNYEEELLRCQRYYWRGHYAQYATVAEFDSGASWTEIFIGVNAMRVTPALIISGSIDYVAIGGETPWVAYPDLRVQETAGGYALGGNRGVAGSPTAGYCYSSDAGGTTIELSAEI